MILDKDNLKRIDTALVEVLGEAEKLVHSEYQSTRSDMSRGREIPE